MSRKIGIDIVELEEIKAKLSDRFVRRILSEEELEFIGDVDILLVPVGGDSVLDGEKAAEVVRQIEPRLVIPMQFKIKDLKIKRSDESKFLKEMGGKSENENKLKISRKDLPEDTTRVIVLEKN